MRYINGGTPTPRAVIENKILPVFLHYDENTPVYGFWAVIEKPTGDFVGWFSFRPEQNTSTEISLGYRLCKVAWGKGYATEGARALIHKGFSDLGIQCVVATTYEKNVASRRVMEKLGMTLKHRFRFTPEDIQNSDTSYTTSSEVWDGDDVLYVLEKTDWEHQQNYYNTKI